MTQFFFLCWNKILKWRAGSPLPPEAHFSGCFSQLPQDAHCLLADAELRTRGRCSAFHPAAWNWPLRKPRCRLHGQGGELTPSPTALQCPCPQARCRMPRWDEEFLPNGQNLVEKSWERGEGCWSESQPWKAGGGTCPNHFSSLI